MAQTTNKKVLVTRFEREPVTGYMQSPGGITASGVELLSPNGTLVQISFQDVKAVSFVRDFEGGEAWKPNRAFQTRPKSPGLWVRLRFRDGDSLEGTLPNNLTMIEESGFHVVPPDPSFQNQRIFVPRAAVTDVQVLGVIGSPLRRKPGAKKTMEEGQLEMFP